MKREICVRLAVIIIMTITAWTQDTEMIARILLSFIHQP